MLPGQRGLSVYFRHCAVVLIVDFDLTPEFQTAETAVDFSGLRSPGCVGMPNLLWLGQRHWEVYRLTYIRPRP